jgi:hypothetical protein
MFIRERFFAGEKTVVSQFEILERNQNARATGPA